jgi:hypothetical protein
MNEYLKDLSMFEEKDLWWDSSRDPKWTTAPIFSCTYCNTDIIEDGIIKRGKIFCNTDCAIKYSLNEAK